MINLNVLIVVPLQDIIWELSSNTPEEMESNVERIAQWVQAAEQE